MKKKLTIWVILALFIGIQYQANAQPPSCSGLTTLTTTTGSFDDGSGANNYQNGQSCSWLIQPTGSVAGDSITLSFSSFALEGCCDYVRVYDGTDATGTQLGSFNGQVIPASVTATSGSMFVTFTSDGSITYQGFEAAYVHSPFVAVPTPCSGATTLTATSGSFDDGSGANNYQNNQNCSWLIQPTGSVAGDSITISLSSIGLESCCDHIRVYDGTDASGPQIGFFTGQVIPASVTATSGSMFVTFISDGSVTLSGFEAAYTYSPYVPTPCSGATTLTATSGSFDDGSGANNYQNNQNCSWLIQPTGSVAGDSITISLSSIGLESCCDHIRVYDGTDASGPQIGFFTGQVIPASVTATSGSMFVTFISDGSVTLSGFEAAYTYSPFVPTPCSGATTLTATSGSFDDGSGVNNYQNGQNCSWLIQPTGSAMGDSITLSFSSFELEGCCDYVTVYDGTDDTGTQLGSFNGTTIPSNVIATSGSMFVTFTSDGSITYQGFEAAYTYSPYVPTPCSGATTLTDSTGMFDDGSEFLNYNNGQNCSWLIQPTGAAAGDSIILSFSSFELESCCDYVTVYDGTDDTGTQLGSFNGTTIPSNVIATSGSMFVTFTSDGSITYQGFEAAYVYSPLICTDSIILNSSTPVTCPGGSDGGLDVTFTGTFTPISYNWSSGQTTNSISNVSAGNYTVIASNAIGCSDTATYTIAPAVDATAPTVVVQDVTIYVDSTGNASITEAQVDNGSSDNCTPTASLSLALSNTSFTCADLGANTVVLTVTDASNNTDTASATVTVQDTIAPVVVTQDITVQLDSSGFVSFTAADIDNGSSDNCTAGGNLTYSLNTSSFTCADLGANTVTLSVTDASGNTATGTATVTVQNLIAPIVVTQNITVQLDANGSATITPAQVDISPSTNNCVTTSSLNISSFSCADVGQNTVILTVTDLSGNSTSATAVVTVEDNIAPTVVTQDITVQLDANGQAVINVADINNGTFDNCGIQSLSIDNFAFICSSVGQQTVTLTAVDLNGNTASATAIVTVEDNIAPVVTANDFTVYLDEFGAASISIQDLNAIATDNCVSDISITLDVDNFDCSNLGSNAVTVTATDVNGNSSSVTVNVEVVDDIAPTLICRDTSWSIDEMGTMTLDPSLVIEFAEDNCNYTTSLSQSVFGVDDIGRTFVTVTVTDEAGNSTSCEAVVTTKFDCITANTIITPNGDAKNDIWSAECLFSINSDFSVFNRFGQLVYKEDNFDGQWDGLTADGKDLPQGAYFYIINADIGAQGKVFKGTITILRK